MEIELFDEPVQAAHVDSAIRGHINGGWIYTSTVRTELGHTVRTTVRFDGSYSEQCSATVEVLTPALTWTSLVHLHNGDDWRERRGFRYTEALSAIEEKVFKFVTDEVLPRGLRVLYAEHCPTA